MTQRTSKQYAAANTVNVWEEEGEEQRLESDVGRRSALRLGAFRLLRILGHGGSGEVWAAEHVGSGMPAAVKMLTRRRARDARYLSLFRKEVQVAASFTHPAIVTLFDHGQVEADIARDSNGWLLPGSPYVAMELVPGGSLSSSVVKRSWPWVRRVLTDVLDALAHVHARGVVHRDVKPGNVLIDVTGAAKLSDFGLAQPFDDEAGTVHPFVLAGTPAYMAPEQIEGRWRDFGPWTDLYALGCLTYFLVSGEPPFGNGEDKGSFGDAHRFLAPPELRSTFDVPRGLLLWARRLLMKEPANRFQCAADAAWGLKNLDQGEASRAVVGSRPLAEPERANRNSPSGGTPTLASTINGVGDTLAANRASGQHATRTIDRRARHSFTVSGREFPLDWRAQTTVPQRLRPLPPSLGLHALRTVSLAGREAECDALWHSLRRVHDLDRARMVLVRGATGFGKSRLAEWLCHRAAELGVGVHLRALHSALGGPGDGLRESLVRHFRVRDVPHAEALSRVAAALRKVGCADAGEAKALADLVVPDHNVSETTTQVEQHALLLRYLARLSAERAVVLWLDDVQWGPSAIAFTEYVLDNRERLPCRLLLILTACEEALVARPVEAAVLEKLAMRPDAHRIELGPIPVGHRAELVQHGLCLQADLAVRVEERTAGNPLFAIQLVGDWVQRGLLEPSAVGLRLRPGADLDMPDHLHAVWMGRIHEVLSARSQDDARALVIAAALGQDVDGSEWQAACECVGLRVPEGLVESLLARSLARQSPDGARGDWSFVHGMLQESIERWARAGRLLAECHLACAHMLKARLSPTVAERLGRHFVLGGAPEQAIGPLVLGAFERLEEGDLRAADALASDIDAALSACNAGADHPGRCDVDLIRAHLGRSRAEFRVGEAHATRALEAARRFGWPARHARALWERGQMATRRGRWEEGEAELREALELSKVLDEKVLIITCLHSLADSLMMRGNPEAERWYAEALHRAEAIGHPRRATFASLLLTLVAAQTGRLEQALSSLDRLRGKDSEPCHAGEAIARLGTLGVVGQAYADMFRGRIYLDQQRFREARTALAQSFDGFALHQRKGEASAALVGLAVSDAALEQWQEFDDSIALADQYFHDTGFIVRDVAMAATSAGDLAARAGRPKSARAAWRLALDMWRTLRDADKVEAMGVRLSHGLPSAKVVSRRTPRAGVSLRGHR